MKNFRGLLTLLTILISVYSYGKPSTNPTTPASDVVENCNVELYNFGTYAFVDAQTGTAIRPFSGTGVTTFALDELGSAQLLTIEAFTADNAGEESLVFTTDMPGIPLKKENNKPYGYLSASSTSGVYGGFTPALGTYTFTVKYYSENYGYGTLLATDTFDIEFVATSGDTAAPNMPQNLTVVFDHNSADLNWDASSDNGGGNVAGYYIYNNGIQIKEVTGGNSTVLTGLIPETPYQITVAAYDDASPIPNVSDPSSTVTFTTEAANDPSTPAGDLWQTYDNIDAFLPTGNVGIGTEPQSDYRLAVDGIIHTKEVLVNETGWADYVFAKDYNLPTLEQVQKHIDEKGHLINIPSAAEVEANGFELGQMNKLLLEKIEELTLYILEQEQRIKKLEEVSSN